MKFDLAEIKNEMVKKSSGEFFFTYSDDDEMLTEDWDKTKRYFNYPDEADNRLMVYGESMDELVSNGEKFGLTHIMSAKDGNSFFSFVDELYENENKYPYLTKVFDAENEDYEKLRIKVFRIDFDVFKSGK